MNKNSSGTAARSSQLSAVVRVLFVSAVLIFCQNTIAVLLPTSDSNPFRTDRILVKVKQGVGPMAMRTLHQLIGGSVRRSYPEMGNLQVLNLSKNLSVAAALNAYRNS